jgi:ABC-2 type transport system permease protein
MMHAGSFAWIAGHELKLAWRDFVSMATGGRRRRAIGVVILVAGFAAFMHWLANATVGGYADAGPDKQTLTIITGAVLLSWSLMLSQALEQVTRAFYSRADLDLLLSSPLSARKLFTVRIAAIAFATSAMALLLIAPFINVLAWHGGPHWLAAYGVVLAMGASATAIAVALADFLFRQIGPRRTRHVSQILAAVIGAVFVIGVQIVAIISSGSLARLDMLRSEALVSHVPGLGSALWWPARAALGDGAAFLAVSVGTAGLFAAVVAVLSDGFAEHASRTVGAASAGRARLGKAAAFGRRKPGVVLRRKEWMLLRRDPWLMSQSLMQVFYLIPPALLLWLNFGKESDVLIVVVPVLVMAAGLLAGGLAWLAISGEDAPDLVDSAPVRPRLVLRAKVEAVMAVVACLFAPFLFAVALGSLRIAIITAIGVAASALSAIRIQLWFRLQARRSHFRRRHTSSRVATFAEALSSIAWAGTVALAAAGTWFAAATAVVAFLVLLGAWTLRPVEARRRRSVSRLRTPELLSPA